MIKIKDMKCGNDNVEFTAMISHVTLSLIHIFPKAWGANRIRYPSSPRRKR